MKKNFKRILMAIAVVIMIIPCALMFTGCNFSVSERFAQEMGYKSVDELMEALKGKDGKDGKDGQDGKDGLSVSQVDSWDMYQTAVENEEFTGTYIDFCKEFIDGTVDTTQAIVNEYLLSVVKVYPHLGKNETTGKLTNPTSTTGSGVIVSLDSNGNAYILTNYHVAYNSGSLLGGAPYYYLYLYQENDPIVATFVGGTATYDLAVLKVKNSDILKNSKAKAVEFNTNDVKVGTGTIAIGNTEGEGIAVSKGTVSVDSETVIMDIVGARDYRLIRHETFISHGNSGGALFNLDGELIGITNGGDDEFEHWNYAIPASVAYKVYQNILANCDGVSLVSAKVFTLGISTYTKDRDVIYNTETGFVDIFDEVTVVQINAGGSVSTAGGLSSGDVLKSIKINNNAPMEITREFHPRELMLTIREGDTIVIKADHAGTEVTVTITASANYFTKIA